MLGLLLTIVGICLFMGSSHYGRKVGVGLEYNNKPSYKFWKSMASLGFWITILGIVVLIWG